MLNSLQTIWENISPYGDRTMYQEMLVILDEIHCIFDEMNIDYPQRVYDEFFKKDSSVPFDF